MKGFLSLLLAGALAVGGVASAGTTNGSTKVNPEGTVTTNDVLDPGQGGATTSWYSVSLYDSTVISGWLVHSRMCTWQVDKVTHFVNGGLHRSLITMITTQGDTVSILTPPPPCPKPSY